MSDLLQLDRDWVPLLGIVCSAIVAVVWVIAFYYRAVQVADMDTSLKMEMIQRGMSAEEITKVLEAKMGSSKSLWFEMLAKTADSCAARPGTGSFARASAQK